MKKVFYYFLAIILLIPTITSAHVKWFVDSKEVIEQSHDLTSFYSWTSKEVVVWSLIVLAIVLIFSFLDKYIRTPKKLLGYGLRNEKTINRISQIILGLFLVSVSFLWKIIIVPEIHVTNSFTTILQYIQILIGLMYILNIKPRLASLILILFCLGVTYSEGIVALFENAILLSLALYFFIVHSPEDSKIFRLKKHAVEIVRIGTGISLITLAITEKIMYPELGLQFLQIHHWNFMQSIFPWFTDKLFVLSTGFAELIFGILFIMGYLTRITTILIAIFFALSVTTMLVQFGAWEVEDLVVYSAAILFIFFGHGKTKFFHFMWPNTLLQKEILGITEID